MPPLILGNPRKKSAAKTTPSIFDFIIFDVFVEFVIISFIAIGQNMVKEDLSSLGILPTH